MSMNRYANAGPIMAGLAAMSQPINANGPNVPAAPLDEAHPAGLYSPSTADLVRMIENVADQLSEAAAQMVDIRKRLDAIETDRVNHAVYLSKRLDAMEDPHKLRNEYHNQLAQDFLGREAARQAQQLATAQQAVTLPLKYDIDAGCWRSGSACFATDQARVDLRIQID